MERGEARRLSFDGKYEVAVNPSGIMYATRYGEYWQNLTGNGLILAMFQEIERLNALVYRDPPSQANR